ncbi:MAG TPA: hypothetical protein VKB48_00270 [Candidatus Acidoferrum sp.]|nr:hypothetical protein [Candidatus Acidoferrum sp.]
MANTLESSLPTPDTVADRTESRFRWIGWSSFLLAIVQSVCTIFVALSGLRLLLGAAAFASAIGAMQIVERIHVDTIRIPMVMFALAGALFNLVALWQVHRLRARSASAWRQKPVSRGKFASEGLQLALSLVTLLLLSLESFYHVRFTHHL